MTRRRKTSNTSSTARGYDQQHKRERARWARRIEQGSLVLCHFCGRPITHAAKASPIDLGYLHLDHTEDRSAYRGPAHAGCNLSDGGKRRGRARTAVVQETNTPTPATWHSRAW